MTRWFPSTALSRDIAGVTGRVDHEVGEDVAAFGRPPQMPVISGGQRRLLMVGFAAVLLIGLGLGATRVLTRSEMAHRGGVLRVVGGPEVGFPEDHAATFDTVIQNSEWQGRLVAMTNDGLVGLRRTGGAHGSGLVPNLAVALPVRSRDGRTYTFHLRRGLRYSTGAPVLAGDFRRGIERAVVHSDTTQLGGYFSLAIIGAGACRDAAAQAVSAGEGRPDCDLREGISTDDETGRVTFHLTGPTPEFLYQLTLPVASAVPQDTPVDLPAGTFLPATGPYQVSSYVRTATSTGNRAKVVLVRNPRFRVWSEAAQPDGFPDRVVLETGYTNQQAVALVSDGRADLLWLGSPTDADQLRTGHGELLHTAAGVFLNFVFLNTTKPPFDNRDARRAVAYGLDRAALTSGETFLSGPVTCQLIPPDFVGYRPYCPFTRAGEDDEKWNGPDLATAQNLVARSGTRGARVELVVADDPTFRAAGRTVVAMLKRLGYRARIRPRADFYDATGNPDNQWNAGLSGWGADYPATSTYVAYLASCDKRLDTYNAAFYCDAQIDQDIAAALDLQASNPDGAGHAWARIDRKVVDAAAIIPYGQSVQRYVVNPRVGHTLIDPITGPLLAQMWVK
jgi:peptide/nickel transport system substrate-binding protein